MENFGLTIFIFSLFVSWGSGANPWGQEKDDTFSKPNHYDGMLEIVGITGVLHMGQIQSGLRSGIRIAQGGHVSILSRGSSFIFPTTTTAARHLSIAREPPL